MKPAALLIALAPVAFCLPATPTSLCGPSETATKGLYTFNNNEYNAKAVKGTNTQCLTVNHGSTSGCAWVVHWDYTDIQNAGGPIGYPYSAIEANKGNLISDISSMPTRAKWFYSSNGDFAADVVYDLFTNSDKNAPTFYGEYEVEIRLGNFNAKNFGPPIGTVTIKGMDWTVHLGKQQVDTGTSQGTITQKTFSFYHAGNMKEFSGDVIDFFNSIGTLKNSYGFDPKQQYLKTFEFGSETLSGGPASLHVQHWDAAVKT